MRNEDQPDAANTKPPLPTIDWPHAPPHRWEPSGTYIVTSATYRGEHHFRGPDRLRWLCEEILTQTREHAWELEAWAVFSNHYHFIARPTLSSGDSAPLAQAIRKIHGHSALYANALDNAQGRKVWHNYWESHLTFERSYLARLNYVHQNAVKHGLVENAANYPWCSAGWFEQRASAARIRTVYAFKTDGLRLPDDFVPQGEC